MRYINYSLKRKNLYLISGIFTFGICIFSLFNSDFGKEAVLKSLEICYRVIIPSMFIYMCICDIMIKCGTDKLFSSLFGKAFEKVFHLPSCYCCAYFISLLCGYAQGANSVAKITKKENIEKKYARQALILCSNPSPSFLIIAVGYYIDSSQKGLLLYLLSVILSFLYSIFTRPKILTEHIMQDNDFQYKNIITSSVTEAVYSTVNICGYIIFFGVICNYIEMLCFNLNVEPISVGILFSIIEISNYSAIIEKYNLPLFLTAFACIWSGLCVHIQTKALAPEIFDSFRFIRAKFIQGIIGALTVLFFQST